MAQEHLKKEAVLAIFGTKQGTKLLNWLDPCCAGFCESVLPCMAQPIGQILYGTGSGFSSDPGFIRQETGTIIINQPAADKFAGIGIGLSPFTSSGAVGLLAQNMTSGLQNVVVVGDATGQGFGADQAVIGTVDNSTSFFTGFISAKSITGMTSQFISFNTIYLSQIRIDNTGVQISNTNRGTGSTQHFYATNGDIGWDPTGSNNINLPTTSPTTGQVMMALSPTQLGWPNIVSLPIYSGVTHTGGGVNNIEPSGAFTGTTATTYTITCIEDFTQAITLSSPISGTDVIVGDTITDCHGAHATVLTIVDPTHIILSTNGGAYGCPSITVQRNSFVLNIASGSLVNQKFHWTDGTTSADYYRTGSDQVLSNGLSAHFTDSSPDTVGDSWSWNFTFTTGSLFKIDLDNQVVSIGDINGVRSLPVFLIDLAHYLISFGGTLEAQTLGVTTNGPGFEMYIDGSNATISRTTSLPDQDGTLVMSIGIATADSTGNIDIQSILNSVPSFVDNTAATLGGLVSGNSYYNSTLNVYTRVI
jgi:hypothetical protein